MRLAIPDSRNGAACRLSVEQFCSAVSHCAGSFTVWAGDVQLLAASQRNSKTGPSSGRAATGVGSWPTVGAVSQVASHCLTKLRAVALLMSVVPDIEAISRPNVHLPSVVEHDPPDHPVRHASSTTDRSRMMSS